MRAWCLEAQEQQWCLSPPFQGEGGTFNHMTCPTVQDTEQWSLQQSSQEPEHDKITWKKQQEEGGTADAHRAHASSSRPLHTPPELRKENIPVLVGNPDVIIPLFLYSQDS